MNKELYKSEIERIRKNPNKDNLAYVILDTEKRDGNYYPVIIQEGKQGYYRTDYNWGSNKDIAIQLANDRNKVMELSIETVEAMVFVSMFH